MSDLLSDVWDWIRYDFGWAWIVGIAVVIGLIWASVAFGGDPTETCIHYHTDVMTVVTTKGVGVGSTTTCVEWHSVKYD